MKPRDVHPLMVDVIFPKVAPYLAKALGDHTAWTLQDLWSECRTGRALLFVDDIDNPQNALVARFETWGGSQVFHLLVMAGEGGGAWPQAIEAVNDWRRQYGCKRTVFSGRKGWERALRKADVIYQAYELKD